MNQFISPVTVPVAAGTGPFFGRLTTNRSVSILKFGSSYQTIPDPSAEQIQAADATYLGGHIYQVTDDEATALAAAGYGAGLFNPETPTGDGSYGSGTYGAGPYGSNVPS